MFTQHITHLLGGDNMNSSAVEKMGIDVSAYEMPENEKVDRLVRALVAEDADTGKSAASGYGVYGVNGSGSYGIMF